MRLTALAIDAESVAVQLPTVAGGLLRDRCRWWEPALQAWREAGFWRQNFEVLAAKNR